MIQPPSPFPLDAYYDSAHQNYLVSDQDHNWMSVSATDVKVRLKQLGFSSRVYENQTISGVEEIVIRIQNERNVQYVGNLAGYTKGIHYINGAKILVTHSPKVIIPKEGDWSLLRHIIDGQLNDDHKQAERFHSWVQLGETALRSCMETGQPTYGQALILAGPKGCGKSLLQKLLTVVLGGRSAGPYRYMAGNTPFNRELFGSEHQKIEDEQPFSDYKSRVRFGDAIKQIAASVDGSCHGKNREAITLSRFWRLTLSVNDQQEHLEILPPFVDSLMDKIILLHCKATTMPMPTGNTHEKTVFWNALEKQLPAYIWWLQNKFTIPAELKVDSERYGMQSFFHPAIMGLLSDMARHTRLLALCDAVLFMDGSTQWDGTAEELQRLLMESSHKYAARNTIPAEAGPGKLLGELAGLPNPRVFNRRTATDRIWRIEAQNHIKASYSRGCLAKSP